MKYSKKLWIGSHNILVNCAELSKGDELLILAEDPSLGWYDSDVSYAVEKAAKDLGINTTLKKVSEPKNDSTSELSQMIDKYDCTIFFARIGDQDRFETKFFKSKRIMSYVRNNKSLASSFGGVNHKAMIEMKEAINLIFIHSENIEITCPLGTNISGKMNYQGLQSINDVGVRRFPLVVPMPISASTFSGNVSLSKYITSTGSKVYEPASIKLNEPVNAEVKNGKIIKFSGKQNVVNSVQDHYENISSTFNLEKNIIHSWHAGMHPGVKYEKPISENPDQWSNTIFASPRYLHFHTCGNYAPGEICWMVKNSTVKVDGLKLWDSGILNINNFKETSKCIEKWSDLKNLYDNQ